MSGKKQHHIPQFLQRGFLFDVKAEKTDAHRRKGVSPLASIADVRLVESSRHTSFVWIAPRRRSVL